MAQTELREPVDYSLRTKGKLRVHGDCIIPWPFSDSTREKVFIRAGFEVDVLEHFAIAWGKGRIVQKLHLRLGSSEETLYITIEHL